MNTTSNGERLLPAPQIDAATAYYFQRAREGVLAIKVCKHCGKPHWYPRALCPFCMGDTEWRDASGQGTIYGVSVTRRAGPEPYAIAYVTLDEGVTMLTNNGDAGLDRLRIG